MWRSAHAISQMTNLSFLNPHLPIRWKAHLITLHSDLLLPLFIPHKQAWDSYEHEITAQKHSFTLQICKWMTQSWDDMLVFQNTSCAQWSVNTGFAIPSHRSYSIKAKHNVGVFRMNVAVMCRWQGAVDHGRLSAWQTLSWLTAVCVFSYSLRGRRPRVFVPDLVQAYLAHRVTPSM